MQDPDSDGRFEAVYNPNKTGIYNFCVRTLNGCDEAKDVVKNVFVKHFEAPAFDRSFNAGRRFSMSREQAGAADADLSPLAGRARRRCRKHEMLNYDCPRRPDDRSWNDKSDFSQETVGQDAGCSTRSPGEAHTSSLKEPLKKHEACRRGLAGLASAVVSRSYR